MAVIRWEREPSAFGELGRLRREVDRLFSDFGMGREPFFSRVYPAVNVAEDEDKYYVRTELPGVKPEDLDVTCVEGNLVIRGEREIAPEEARANYHRREREGGTFRRIVSLPGRVETTKVAAGLKNGVLTVTLPKGKEAKPRKIAVKGTK